jgi:hypothetical protein
MELAEAKAHVYLKLKKVLKLENRYLNANYFYDYKTSLSYVRELSFSVKLRPNLKLDTYPKFPARGFTVP